MERKPNVGEVFAGSLAKGLANYAVEKQRQQDEQRQGALQAFQMQLQQQEAQQQAQMARMRMEQMRQQMVQTDLEMQKLRRESTLTWEERQRIEHENKLAQIEAQKQADIAEKNAELRRYQEAGLIPGGAKQATPAGPTKFPPAVITAFTNLQGKNVDIAKTNAKMMDEWNQNKAIFPDIPMPDTLPHLNVAGTMNPLLSLAGLDTLPNQQVVDSLPIGNPAQTTPADQMGMEPSYEELIAELKRRGLL